MTDRFACDLVDAEAEWFVCSAVVSARSIKGTRQLSGVPLRDNADRKELAFKVPEVPERWDDTWKHGDYNFQLVSPRVPANGFPPAQQNLDRVFEYITKD